jgi:pyruvate dehydrogenase E1 component alpha subunit
VDGLEAGVAQEIGRAVAFAEAGSLEPVEDLEKDVYTPRTESPAPLPR